LTIIVSTEASIAFFVAVIASLEATVASLETVIP
jgi:hypothetical protein